MPPTSGDLCEHDLTFPEDAWCGKAWETPLPIPYRQKSVSNSSDYLPKVRISIHVNAHTCVQF